MKSYPHSSYKNSKYRTPGGFVIIVKNSIKKHVKVVKQSDHVIWIRLSNLIDSPVDSIFICSVYIPHENSVLRDLDNNEIIAIQNDIEYFSSLGIIYPIGDWNARVGDLIDFVKCNSSNTVPPNSDAPRRLTVDKKVNLHGKKLISLCKTTGFQIQNGRNNPTETNMFTCFRHNGQSTVDYLLSKKENAHLLKEFRINPRTIDSDHCAITFSLPTKAKDRLKGRNKNIHSKKRNIIRYNEV